MGLDMTVGKSYVRLNWAGMRAFAAWTKEYLGTDYFDLLTPGWSGGNGEEMDIDRLGIKKFILLYHGLVAKDTELKVAQDLVIKGNILDSTADSINDFLAYPDDKAPDDDPRWKEASRRYYKIILAMTYREVHRAGNKPVHFYMG